MSGIMNPMGIMICIRVLRAVIAVETFIVLIAMAAVYHPGRLVLRVCQEAGSYLRSREKIILDYGKLKSFLERNGVAYHYGTWMNPVTFTALRLVAAGTGLMLGAYLGLAYGMVLALLLFWLPGMLLVYLNGKDNERLLPELKLVYHSLTLQIRAGVYVTDALAETYGSVQDIRLRSALLELSGDIVMKAGLEEALERFQGKFDNRYVDSLCITILQAMESGQAVELLSDIAEQMKDMETAVMSRKKSSLDRSITFYQLGILAAVLVIVLYACVTHMFSAAMNF